MVSSVSMRHLQIRTGEFYRKQKKIARLENDNRKAEQTTKLLSFKLLAFQIMPDIKHIEFRNEISYVGKDLHSLENSHRD